MVHVGLSHLFTLLFTIVVIFVFYKRPIYEAMFVGFIVMVAVLGKYDKIFYYLLKPSTNTLFYSIVSFLALAFIFANTSAISYVIDFIVAVVGRFKGGAGWVSLISSTFMSALSGSGPGNVAADGVFNIPAMIRTKFPRALAATVEMSASSLGPMIPPSATILLAFGILDVMLPGKYQLSSFWLVVWSIGFWFIIQRALVLYGFIKFYNVEAMPAQEIPGLKQTIKKGWKSLIIPVIILFPILFDAMFGQTLIISRLGANGAKAFSNSVILFTPGVAAIYTLLISKKDIEGGLTPINIIKLFKKGIPQIVPVAATVYFAYCISELFADAKIGEMIGDYISSLNMGKTQLAIFIPLFTCFLGMFIPGSSQIAIFGTAIVGGLYAVGVNPLLAAAILPAITGAMEGMTPPLALAMYTAMGIAKSGMKETSLLALIWIFWHLLFSILILVGLLPIMII